MSDVKRRIDTILSEYAREHDRLVQRHERELKRLRNDMIEDFKSVIERSQNHSENERYSVPTIM